MEQQLTAADLPRILDLLAPSSTDSQKFVALTLLPRLLEPNKETMMMVFEAMDFNFIERLLRTKSSNPDMQDGTLKSIAVNILSCFCMHDDLLEKKQLVNRIPSLAKSVGISEEMSRDIFKIFIKLSSAEKGLVQLTDVEVINTILNTLKTSKDGKSIISAETKRLAFQAVHCIGIQVLAHLATDANSGLISSSDLFNEILPELSLLFRTYQDQLKFDLLNMFVDMFSYFDDKTKLNRELRKDTIKFQQWIENLRQGLRDILSSHLGPEQRDQSLMLTSLLLHHFDAEWLFSPPSTKSSSDKRPDEQIRNEAKFAILVIQLACIEIRLMLDSLAEQQRNKADNHDPRLEKMLPTCYTILESSIEYLAKIGQLLEEEEAESGEDAALSLPIDPELLLKLKNILTETFRAIMDYLVDVKTELMSVEEACQDTRIIATIRVLSRYLSEEATMEKEIREVMPFLVDVAAYR
ncbi:7728_t:CDS:2 [Paraglomus occultum]|uniref:7728_t:CDS:1 n=1 Tax=Paraglomus occultum TaxID=144539 RepID=A0A9N9B672_9GLOM|nr:7728_t:CDS:2 [Paraglomus occultum]